MRFKVIVNTFKRPARALAVVECLRAMSSRDDEGRRNSHRIVERLVATGRQAKVTPHYLRAKHAAERYLADHAKKAKAA